MAAHTTSGSGGNTRWFFIGRKNFEDAGKPVFKEYFKILPPEQSRKGRNFEERNGAFYETFEELDGLFTGFEWKAKTIQNVEQTMLIIVLEDAGEKFRIEIGNWDGRYSMNFMQRVCDPRFNPQIKIAVRPYAGTNNTTGKPYFGINVTNGVDAATNKPLLLEPRKSEPGIFDLPIVEPKIEKVSTGPGTWKEKQVFDFYPQAQFLVNYMTNVIKPKLPNDIWEVSTAPVDDEPVSTNHPTIPSGGNQQPGFRTEPTGDDWFPAEEPGNVRNKNEAPPVSTDDLPF